jgi:hypothetical protein
MLARGGLAPACRGPGRCARLALRCGPARFRAAGFSPVLSCFFAGCFLARGFLRRRLSRRRARGEGFRQLVDAVAETVDFFVQGEQVLTACRELHVEVVAHAVDAVLDGAARRLAGLDGLAGLFLECGTGFHEVAKQLRRFHAGFFEPPLGLVDGATVGTHAGQPDVLGDFAGLVRDAIAGPLSVPRFDVFFLSSAIVLRFLRLSSWRRPAGPASGPPCAYASLADKNRGQKKGGHNVTPKASPGRGQ